jgi:hypothetical protein
LTFDSAIARKRCWTLASSGASVSPFLISPVLVLPSQTQTGIRGGATLFGFEPAAVAVAIYILLLRLFAPEAHLLLFAPEAHTVLFAPNALNGPAPAG